MEIAEKDFKLKPVSEDAFIFDIELLYTVKPRGGEPRLEFKNVAYGCSLESAIKKIAHYRVCCKHKDAAIRLTTYFKDFITEINKLKTLLEKSINLSENETQNS